MHVTRSVLTTSLLVRFSCAQESVDYIFKHTVNTSLRPDVTTLEGETTKKLI